MRLRAADGRTAMLMDAAPARGEDVRPFAALTGWLRGRGFSAPAVEAADLDVGFLLLEDLGDALFSACAAAEPALEPTLYGAAVDLLAALHAEPPPPEAVLTAPVEARAPLAAYDLDAHLAEARLYLDWWATGLGRAPSSADRAAFDQAVAEALGPAAAAREAACLRDYHAENLIWLPTREGVARVGLLDYQDARAGHPAYDLMSLLEDARRDVPPELAEAMIIAYAARAGVADLEAFRAAYAALAAVRNLKIIGIFARLWLRDGKNRYLSLFRRVEAHLRRDLAHPTLHALRAVVEALAPAPSDETIAAIRATPTAAAPPRRPHFDTAMLLAAGRGMRMRPLTDATPKPLLHAAGRALLDRAADQATALGAARIVVNTHYLGEQIAAHLASRADARFSISAEAEALETGGGVLRALPLIDRPAFLVFNSDNVWTDPAVAAPVLEAWDAERMDALLLLAPKAAARGHAGSGDFFLEADGRLRRRAPAATAPYIYCGAHALAASLFEGEPEGAFSLNVVWDKAIARGRAFGVVAPGLWVDVGTPSGLAMAEAALSSGESAP